MRDINLAHILQLTRPLGMFDLESTGVDPLKDRIVQIAITSHHPDKDPIRWQTLVNPGVPIPKAASDVHGITDAMVENAPRFAEVARVLVPRMIEVDLGGHNVRYDIDLFRAECSRAGLEWKWDGHVVDTLALWRKMRPMTLSAAYEEFEGEKLDDAHKADVDVQASEVVLEGMLKRWASVPRTVPEIGALLFPRNPNAIDRDGKVAWREDGVAILTFGKHAGKTLREAPADYLKWCVRDGNFSAEVKQIFSGALNGVFPVK